MSQKKSDKKVKEAADHSDHPLEDRRLVADESDVLSDAAVEVSQVMLYLSPPSQQHVV